MDFNRCFNCYYKSCKSAIQRNYVSYTIYDVAEAMIGHYVVQVILNKELNMRGL